MSAHELFDLYRITGNTKPMRLGRVFPTGWTAVEHPHAKPGEVYVATRHNPNALRGTHLEHVGRMTMAEVFRTQKAA